MKGGIAMFGKETLLFFAVLMKETYLKELFILIFQVLFSNVCICSEINYFDSHKINYNFQGRISFITYGSPVSCINPMCLRIVSVRPHRSMISVPWLWIIISNIPCEILVSVEIRISTLKYTPVRPKR